MFSLNMALVGLIGATQGSLALYEPDLYSAVAPYVWPALFAALGFPVIVFLVSDKGGRVDRRLAWWLLAAFVIGTTGLGLVPWARYPAGYDRWDSWYHLAEVKLIAAVGHTSQGNFYPATHLEIAQLAELSGVPMVALFRWVPALISGLVVLTTFATCEWIGITPKGGFFAAVGVSSLLSLPFVLPVSLSFVFLVIIVGLLATPVSGGYRVLILVFFAAVVITHLLTAISVAIGILAFLPLSRRSLRSNVRLFALASVMLLSWVFWMTTVYVSPIRLIALIISTGAFRAKDYSQILATVGLSGFSALLVVVAITAARIGTIVLASPAAVHGFRSWRRRAVASETRFGAWALSNLASFLILGTLFGTGTIGDLLDRFVNFGLAAIVFLVGFSSGFWSTKKSRRRVAATALCLMIVGAEVAFFYPAPSTARYNWETGTTDVDGLLWISRNVETGRSFNASDYNHAILSGLIGTQDATARGFYFGMDLPPDLGCAAGGEPKTDYLVVTSFDLYVFGRRHEILPSDFDCVQNSGVWDVVYDNGGFWVFAHT